jgi:hypothetical protein
MKTIYLLLIALLATACDGDDAPIDQESLLPPITMTGENTFGCLIDGKFFRPRDGTSTINSDNKGLKVFQTESTNWEIHVFDRKSDKTGSLYIHIENIFLNSIGSYNIEQADGLRGLDGPNNTYIYGRFWNEELNNYANYHSVFDSGTIEITQENHNPGNFYIISGIFSANLINRENVSDTLKITKGRFDIESLSLQFANFN